MFDTAFRKYDIRGIVGTELIVDQVSSCIESLIYIIKKDLPSLRTVCVGRDGRLHSDALYEQVIDALIKQGLLVIDVGLVPTPVHAFAQRVLPLDAGLMITASHNPGNYNGIKITLQNHPYFDQKIQSTKLLFQNRIHHRSTHQGSVIKVDIVQHYLSFMEIAFAHLKNYQKPLAFDCSNGPTGPIIEQLVARMNWNATILNSNVDGNFPAHDPDPTKLKNMRQLLQVVEEKQAFGIAFDGDGDRFSALTEKGEHLVGDDLSALFCSYIAQKNPGAVIVLDIKCSMTLVRWLQSQGLTVIQTPCGHGYTVDAMLKYNALYGGELSCHFCFNDRYFGIDDGIYAACRLIELCFQRAETLAMLAATLPERYLSPEMRIPCPEELKDAVVSELLMYAQSQQSRYTINTLDGLCAYNDEAATTIRKSNTESLLSVRFEGNSQQALYAIMKEFHLQLEYFIDPVILKPFFASIL